MAISLNPGFLLLLAAVLALLLPNRARQGALLAAGLAAAWASFSPPFGDAIALKQVGLVLTPLKLDATSQLYGFTALLIAILAGIAGFSRRDRFEDLSLLAHLGGAASAAFAGDLATFVACSCISALGACGLTLSGRTPDARNAGVRLLAWHTLSGLMLVVGAGLVWASAGVVRLEPMALATPAGGLLFIGLLIQAGAPLAHVWMRDGISHAGGVGAATLAAVAAIPAFVGLARLFPGEALLMPIGAVLAVGPLALALAEPDWRRAAAYGVLSQNGFVLAALGLATPLALAGAASSAFAHALGAMSLILALGAVRNMIGGDQATGPGSAAATQTPTLAAIAVVAALSFNALPGTAGYAARSLLLEAFRGGAHGWLWLGLTAATAGAVVHGGFKAPYAAFFGPRPAPLGAEPAFPMTLAAGLAAFLLVAIGVTPQWIYNLAPPGQVFHEPFAPPALIAQVLLIATAGAAYFSLLWSPAFPSQRPAEILEIDWLWRRPGRAVARHLGERMLTAFAAANAMQDKIGDRLRSVAQRIAARLDRPSAVQVMGPGLALSLAALTIAVICFGVF